MLIKKKSFLRSIRIFKNLAHHKTECAPTVNDQNGEQNEEKIKESQVTEQKTQTPEIEINLLPQLEDNFESNEGNDNEDDDDEEENDELDEQDIKLFNEDKSSINRINNLENYFLNSVENSFNMYAKERKLR